MRILLQLLLLGALSCGGALAVRAWHPRAPLLYPIAGQIKEGEIDLQQALAWRAAGRLLWIDARPRAQYEAGHIEGAVLLNEQDDFNLLLMDSWATLQNNADKHLVVYCGAETCGSSRKVAALLRDRAGFPDVHVLLGGVQVLRDAGLLPSR
jgi:rhodanese-related sulfurtransferase